MPDGLTFSVNWTDTATVDVMAAKLRIDVAGHNACIAENRWSRTVEDASHLSALPLALWLAASWWRLCFEPDSEKRDTSWKMAHELGAAGSGFLWPRLTFISDGECVRGVCLPSDSRSLEMLRYISHFDVTISLQSFMRGIDDLIELVIERLETTGESEPLKGIWQAVVSDRRDPEATTYRRLEAILGFDPDEAPPSLVARLLELSLEIGAGAGAEVAGICRGAEPDTTLSEVLRIAADSSATVGHIDRRLVANTPSQEMSAPDRGRSLARQVRQAANIPATSPITDTKLAELLGMRQTQLAAEAPKHPLFALAITNKTATEDRFLFRSPHPLSRRFEASRLLCDGLMHGNDVWHPATKAITARQKAQRSFAAEFLAPITGLQDYLRGDYSMDAIEGAAEYYDVSSYTVGSSLANNSLISRHHPSVPISG